MGRDRGQFLLDLADVLTSQLLASRCTIKGDLHYLLWRGWRCQGIQSTGLNFQTVWNLASKPLGQIHQVERSLVAHLEFGFDPFPEMAVAQSGLNLDQFLANSGRFSMNLR